MGRLNFFAAGLAAALAVASAVAAQEPGVSAPALFREWKTDSAQPLDIRSDKMGIELGRRRVQFSGHVIARQADRVIYADTVEADYEESGKLSRLTARGNVKMTAGEALATGDELELDAGKGVLILRGSPRVQQAGQVIRGREMTFHLAENRLEITEPRIEWIPAAEPNAPPP